MLELPHDAIVIPFCDALRIADGALDEGFEATLEQLIHLVVIVIVVPDPEHALYVIPDRASEARRVDLVVRAHGIIRQIVRGLEFLVEEITDVVVQTVHQGVAVIVPGIILDAEGRDVVQLAALERRKEVVVGEEGGRRRGDEKSCIDKRKCIAKDVKKNYVERRRNYMRLYDG